MALFKRNRRDKQAIAAALDEAQRYSKLAGELGAKTGRDLGMDIETIMREGERAMAGGGQQQVLAYRARLERCSQHGVETPARVRSVALGQPSPLQGGVPAQMELTVEPVGRAPYDVSTDQVLAEPLASTLAPGQQVTVKVDPDDPRSLILWAQAPAITERLAKLEELRASGVLTDAEFEAQKTKLEGS